MRSLLVRLGTFALLPALWLVISMGAMAILCSDPLTKRAVGDGMPPNAFVVLLEDSVPSMLQSGDLDVFRGEHPLAQFIVPLEQVASLNDRLSTNGNPAYPQGRASWKFEVEATPAGQRIQTRVYGKNNDTITSYTTDGTAVHVEWVKTYGTGQAILAGMAGLAIGIPVWLWTRRTIRRKWQPA